MIGSRALVDHVAEAGLRIVNHTEFATRADVVVVADHERFHYAELRTATQAVLRGAELIGLSRDRDLPDARRRLAGHRRDPGRGRDRHRPQGRRGRRQAEPAMYEAARDRLGRRDASSRSATASTPTCSAPSAPGSTPRSCSPAPPTARRSTARTPAPTHVADSLAALLLT